MRWRRPRSLLGRGTSPRKGVVKILADVRDQLTIRRVVGCLDADDVRLERGGVLLRVSEKVQLGHRRSDEQNLVGARERRRDGLEEAVLVVRMVVGPRLLIPV